MTTAPLLPNDVNSRPERRASRPGRSRPFIWGSILLVAGLLTLFSTLNLFSAVSGIVFALLFAAAALAFGYVFLRNSAGNWWAAVPAFALAGLSGSIMISEYAPERMTFLGGAVFLGALGLGFLAVYLARRDFWWAVIPAGAMLSLAVTAALDEGGFGRGNDDVSAGVFFFGLGLTFLVVARLRPRIDRSRQWAYIPAAILMLLGTFLFTSATTFLVYFNVIVAVVMVGAGAFLILKSRGERGAN